MLSFKFRFHGYKSLQFLFKHGKTYRQRGLSVRVAKNSRLTDSRVAVIISRKVLKSAPARNRVRRRMYEIIREKWPVVRQGYDIAVLVYDGEYATRPYAEIQQELLRLLEEAGIVKPSL